MEASSPPRTPTWRPQALQGPQLGGPKPSKDPNLEAPDLEFCSPSWHFSSFFDNSIFTFQNALGLPFLSSWRLLGRLLGPSWMLLCTSWGYVGASWAKFLTSWTSLWKAQAPWDPILGSNVSQELKFGGPRAPSGCKFGGPKAPMDIMLGDPRPSRSKSNPTSFEEPSF